MLAKILIYIKKHFGFIWRMIEWFNSIMLSLLFAKRYSKLELKYRNPITIKGYTYKSINAGNADDLYNLFSSLDNGYLQYFNPHKRDKISLLNVLKSNVFFTLGVFYENRLIGYFFLRLFFNRRAFIGRLVNRSFKGKGIAKEMARLLYEISDEMGFNVYSTISKNNLASLKSHEAVRPYTVVKELPDDYLLIRFDKNETTI